MQEFAQPAARGPRAVFEQLESRVVLSVAAPTGLDATLAAPRAVVVEWNDVDGETGYVIERRVDGSADPFAPVGQTAANVTRFTQDGLLAGKTYLYRVRARQGDASSEPSNVDAVTTPAEPAVPAAPRLEFVRLDNGGVKLVWTNVANETGYTVQRRVDGSPVAFDTFATTDADVTTVTDNSLQADKTYLYRVRAFNAQGSSAFSNTVVVPPSVTGAPAAPRELVAEVVQGTFVRLRWVDVANEKGYRIERRLGGSGEWVQVGTTGQNVITFADERVDAGKTYVYRVRAFNDAGNSPYSNTAAVTVPGETGAPAAPRELNAELGDGRRVRLTWADVANEKGYKVERRLDGTDAWTQVGTTAPNVTTFVDERVDAGKTYIYRVRAFNDAGDSSYSNTDAVTIPAAPAAPVAPRLEVDLVAPRAAKLTWTNVANETGYRVQRRVDGTDAWQTVRTVGADVRTVTDDGLEPGKTYLYRVIAFNAAGNSPASNVGVARVAQAGLPTAPRELRAASVSASRIELRWVDSTGETGYRIERRVAGTDAWTKIGARPANATSFVDESVTAGTAYQYRVRAFNEVGNSPFSNVLAVKAANEVTRPAAPRGLRAEAVSPTQIVLRWLGVDGETGYRVERRLEGTDAWAKVGFAAADVTTFIDKGVLPGKSYQYRVRAAGEDDSSAWSNVVTAKTPEGVAAAVFSTKQIL
jgi:titin